MKKEKEKINFSFNEKYSESELRKIQTWVEEELDKKEDERAAASLAINNLYLNKYFYAVKPYEWWDSKFYIYVVAATPSSLRVLSIPLEEEITKDEYGICSMRRILFETLYTESDIDKKTITNLKEISKEEFEKALKEYYNKIFSEE